MDPAAPHSPVILVVDNEDAVLLLLTHIFTRHGFVVQTARKGEDAVEIHRRGGIDVVLLDVGMAPPCDGPAVLVAMRATDPKARVAFMSGGIGAYTADELLSLGAARVFTKPFSSIDDLVGGLRELVATGALPAVPE